MVKVYGSGKNHNRDPISQRPPPVKDPETSQRTQVSAASVLSQSPSLSSSPLSTGFSGRVISQDSDSSTAEKTQQAADTIIPPEERKEPFEDQRPNAPPHPRSSVESYDTDLLNELLKPAECQELFKHIADNPRLTDEQKLFTIREQMKQEAKVFGLSYTSQVKGIIKYVNSAARRDQIALAEIDFAKALIDELRLKGHQIDILQAEYNLITDRYNDRLIPDAEEKAQRLSNAIADWQLKNPDIVTNISSISLKGQNIKVIPQYIVGFTNLKELILWDNTLTDISALTALVSLEILDLSDNNINDISPLATLINLEVLDLRYNNLTNIFPLSALVNLECLILDRNIPLDRYILSNLVKLTILHRQDPNRTQRLRNPINQDFDSINTESVELPDETLPLKNRPYLSNGRMIEILEGEIKTKAMELPLKIFDMKRYMHYNANIAQLFMGGVFVISWRFLNDFLPPIYNVEETPKYCYEGFDIPDSNTFTLVKYIGLSYIAKKTSDLCGIQRKLRKQEQQFNLTKEKISALIKELNLLDPADPLLASSLPSYASEIYFSPETLKIMINEMSESQILRLKNTFSIKFKIHSC